jgi:hypothetical protein
MKTIVQPVRLSTVNGEESRLVKSAALFTFRGIRALVDAAKEVPGIVTQAASDVREAWEESNTSPKL